MRAILVIAATLTVSACQQTNSAQSCETALEHLAVLSAARVSASANVDKHAVNIARGARSSFLASCRDKSEAQRRDFVSCVLDADDMSDARRCQK